MPHSLLKLWKRKGGVLEELLVDGNPLIQPSVLARHRVAAFNGEAASSAAMIFCDIFF
jgi:hypothetical protein